MYPLVRGRVTTDDGTLLLHCCFLLSFVDGAFASLIIVPNCTLACILFLPRRAPRATQTSMILLLAFLEPGPARPSYLPHLPDEATVAWRPCGWACMAAPVDGTGECQVRPGSLYPAWVNSDTV